MTESERHTYGTEQTVCKHKMQCDLYRSALPEGTTLRLYCGSDVIFQSSGHWLMPLFELEDFLDSRCITDRSRFSLHDSVDGRAAAFLTCRLGIKTVYSDIASRLACIVFESYKVKFSYGTLVDRIMCKTEDLITDSMEPDEVYSILCSRAGRKKNSCEELAKLSLESSSCI